MFLHATRQFNATQKGQVSLTELNEFELLSDAHWYWWFIRIRESGAEGFVPAEIVELPAERQARLNRQINTRVSYDPTSAKVSKRTPKKSVRFNDPLWECEPTELFDVGAPVSPTGSDESDNDISVDNLSLDSSESSALFDNEDSKNITNTNKQVRIQGSLDDFGSTIAAQAL